MIKGHASGSVGVASHCGIEKKFQYQTRAEEVAITRLLISHTEDTKPHPLSQGPPSDCHHCGQTFTMDHMLLECQVVKESRDKYYTALIEHSLWYHSPGMYREFRREAVFFSDMNL